MSLLNRPGCFLSSSTPSVFITAVAVLTCYWEKFNLEFRRNTKQGVQQKSLHSLQQPNLYNSFLQSSSVTYYAPSQSATLSMSALLYTIHCTTPTYSYNKSFDTTHPLHGTFMHFWSQPGTIWPFIPMHYHYAWVFHKIQHAYAVDN